MDHTIDLIQKSHEGDEEARARLVEENAGLVWCIVKRFHNRGVETEDLFQIGNIGHSGSRTRTPLRIICKRIRLKNPFSCLCLDTEFIKIIPIQFF